MSLFNKLAPSREHGLRTGWIVAIVALVLILIALVTTAAQYIVETRITASLGDMMKDLDERKKALEISKMDAEISKIRSDTVGSLFWLKLIALFVTVGGAVGGYLVGQDRATHARVSFEDRKNVDAVYQSIVRELSEESPILRAAAAVKLGAVLQEFPHEWHVSDERKAQLVQLTKQVIAAAVSIETDQKVLKTLTINLVLHKPWKDVPDRDPKKGLANARELDLSGAKASDAYWAKTDFSYADFYNANVSAASFRRSLLAGAQFREANLAGAVLVEANCEGASFKMANLTGADLSGADLRNSDFSNANLSRVNLKESKLHGTKWEGAKISDLPDTEVDVSEKGDGTKLVQLNPWLAEQGAIREGPVETSGEERI